jgi:hypothetical protein
MKKNSNDSAGSGDPREAVRTPEYLPQVIVQAPAYIH